MTTRTLVPSAALIGLIVALWNVAFEVVSSSTALLAFGAVAIAGTALTPIADVLPRGREKTESGGRSEARVKVEIRSSEPVTIDVRFPDAGVAQAEARTPATAETSTEKAAGAQASVEEPSAKRTPAAAGKWKRRIATFTYYANRVCVPLGSVGTLLSAASELFSG